MKHTYHLKKGTSKDVIITLHGTGGDEYDLDNVAEIIRPDATVIGVRGNVNENGLQRWFQRYSPGEFDEEDTKQRVYEFASWLPTLSEKHGFELEKAVFLGFSNGANMLAATMQLRPASVQKAVLLHGQVPLPDEEFSEQSGEVFLATGKQDRIIPSIETYALRDKLEDAGIQTETFTHHRGHTVTRETLRRANEFLY